MVFRVLWGIFGGSSARFGGFIAAPGRTVAYAMALLRGREPHFLGHNPLGALSVLGLLTVLGLQASGGLFANDDIAFQGPLYGLVSKDTSDWMTGLHRKGFWLVLALVGLHLAAIVFYTRVKGEKLVGAMLNGHKEVIGNQPAEAPTGGGFIAVIFALAIGIASAWAASGAWVPPPPAPEPAAAPAW